MSDYPWRPLPERSIENRRARGIGTSFYRHVRPTAETSELAELWCPHSAEDFALKQVPNSELVTSRCRLGSASHQRRLTGAALNSRCSWARSGDAGVATCDPTDRRRDHCTSTAALTAGRPAEGWAADDEPGDGLVIDTGAGDFGGWDLGGDGSGAPMRFHRSP